MADTLVTGSRYLEGIVDEEKEPVEGITERHFKRGFYSPIHDDVFRNARNSRPSTGKHGAKAVIYVHIEFCESEEYDLPDLKRVDEGRGHPLPHDRDRVPDAVSLPCANEAAGVF